jgi:hypothetical protein
MILSTAPIALIASVVAVRRNRKGLVSRSALALSTLEVIFVIGIVLLVLLN